MGSALLALGSEMPPSSIFCAAASFGMVLSRQLCQYSRRGAKGVRLSVGLLGGIYRTVMPAQAVRRPAWSPQPVQESVNCQFDELSEYLPESISFGVLKKMKRQADGLIKGLLEYLILEDDPICQRFLELL